MSSKQGLIFVLAAGAAGAVLYSLKKDFSNAKEADQVVEQSKPEQKKNDKPGKQPPRRFDLD
jgi:hypothetical protein